MSYGKSVEHGIKKAAGKETGNYNAYGQNYDGMLLSLYS